MLNYQRITKMDMVVDSGDADGGGGGGGESDVP